MDPNTLTALSPLDGRYASKVAPLREHLSEYALIRFRVLAEIRWLQHLADESAVPDLKPFEPPVKDVLNRIVDRFSIEDAKRVKQLESETNHDVKAVEYYLREQLQGVTGSATNIIAFLHFACTSEDINNIAYALMLRRSRRRVLVPALKDLAADAKLLAHRFADLPMLARTHGQPASPTTLGKEMANFLARLRRQTDQFSSVEIMGKFNGAVGNFNAHAIAYPDCDWATVSNRFVQSLDLVPAEYTTQIEPHDWIAEYAQALSRCNTVLIDLCRDLWAYVGLGYFRPHLVEGEIGSSTMPHKVNPIEFENAEGNLGVANALLAHFANKLPISRWQRDLTDSTVLRNLSTALGHSLLAFDSCRKGLGKLDADVDRIAADIDASPEVLAEAIQTVMRRHGIADAYEQLKSLTRGKQITAELLRDFVGDLPLDAADKKRLQALEPANYIGLAAELARRS